MQCNLTQLTHKVFALQCPFPSFPTQYYYVNNTDMWHITICLGMIRMQIHKPAYYIHQRESRPEMHQNIYQSQDFDHCRS